MRRPNFIVIITDDQAYGDLGCMGATDLLTPHLDALAARGALLLSWYSNSPVCSPSRASFLTGRYPGNAGVRSIHEGGIRSPALASWPARIPAGQTIAEIGVAMDIFPTLVHTAGGDLGGYEIDGRDVLPMLAERAASPHDAVFWEMGRQTAVRKGPWKLVLHGQLVEGAPAEDEEFLSDLANDPADRTNLRERRPDVTAELREAATTWRQAIEERWERQWRPLLGGTGTTTWR